jgi:hypothetical protein
MHSGEKRKERVRARAPFNCLSRHAESVSTDDERRERENQAKIETPFLIKEITRAADERRKTSVGRAKERERKGAGIRV